MPSALAKTNAKGTPVISIIVAAVVGCLAFGPFKSWTALVNVVTLATAIMYGFAPISLAALHRLDRDRPRSYRVPAPRIVLPAAFCSANLIIYWSGFDATWKLVCAMIVGLILFGIGARRAGSGLARSFRGAYWMAPWFAGHVLLGAYGRYGGNEALPDWIDVVVTVAFSLVIFRLALRTTLTVDDAASAIAQDAHQIEYLELPGARVREPGAR